MFLLLSGIETNGKINDETKAKLLLHGNTITNTRALGILICRPNQPFSNGVDLKDNVFLDTGEKRELNSFPGLKHCIEHGRCTRTVTGKRFELQTVFVCEQCDFTDESDRLLCLPCANLCHKGHKGLFMHAESESVYCDCPEYASCPIFEKDPMGREDKPN